MIWKKGAERLMSERLYNLLARFGGNIGFVGSGIHCFSSQSLSKSSKNWFEKRTSGGTVKTAKQLRIQRLAVFFFLHPSTAPAPAKRNLVKNSGFSWRNKIFLILLQKTG